VGAYAADTNCIRQPTALALAFGLKCQPEVQSLHHRPDAASPGYTRLKADGERELSQLRWRLVPAWEKDISIGSRMINARAESIATSREFATPTGPRAARFRRRASTNGRGCSMARNIPSTSASPRMRRSPS